MHPRLIGCAAAFFLITGFARSHDIFPGFIAALYDRNDVIQGEVGFLEAFSAVLAALGVSNENVGA